MKFWWGLGVLIVGAAIYYCLAPMPDIPSAFEFSDKLSHILGHAAMAVYFSGLVARRSWWKIFVSLLLLGVAIEFAQHYTHWGRQGDFRDVLANSVGAALGLLLGRLGLARWPDWVGRVVGLKTS